MAGQDYLKPGTRVRRIGRIGRWLNLPNAVSLLRFPLAALFPIANGTARIAIVAAAAASDLIDGRLARRTGQVTRVGEMLDPVADKAFMLAALITLAVDGPLPLWTLPLLLTRDVGVALGAVVLALRGVRVRMTARPAGKLVTWLQFLGIGILLLWPDAAAWIALTVGLAGLLALFDYASTIQPLAANGNSRSHLE
ncbi:MAG: CDP-alcohol phosphatidyltransferase family protein [Longimicrobiales bacterium]